MVKKETDEEKTRKKAARDFIRNVHLVAEEKCIDENNLRSYGTSTHHSVQEKLQCQN